MASLGSVLASRKSPVRSTTKGASSLELARDTWPTRPLSASARDNDDVEVVDAITAAAEIPSAAGRRWERSSFLWKVATFLRNWGHVRVAGGATDSKWPLLSSYSQNGNKWIPELLPARDAPGWPRGLRIATSCAPSAARGPSESPAHGRSSLRSRRPPTTWASSSQAQLSDPVLAS